MRPTVAGVQWRYVRLVDDAGTWALHPHLEGYDTKLAGINNASDEPEGEALSELLEALGSAGWELIQVDRLGDEARWLTTFFFKREISMGPTVSFRG